MNRFADLRKLSRRRVTPLPDRSGFLPLVHVVHYQVSELLEGVALQQVVLERGLDLTPTEGALDAGILWYDFVRLR